MIKRIVDVSEAAYLHLKQRQLLIDKNGALAARIPIEDLGVLILQHPAIVMSQSLIVACQENNVVVVFCDARHLPYAVILPLVEGHSLHAKILDAQRKITLPTKKRLWKHIVQQKIAAQALTLEWLGENAKPLEHLSKQVKTGDTGNHEAQAAQKYWPLLMGRSFRRRAEEDGVNALLNYGYAILRAAVARAIVGSGLHPAIGLHHRNQYNGLCLADDLMEPFRPWVDFRVRQLALEKHSVEINTETKKNLLSLLSAPVEIKGKRMPMMISCHYLMADFKRAFDDRTGKLHFPRLLHEEDP